MSSGFITESEIAERRRVRQEEWEKVRKPDQPLEAPEETYEPQDFRSLYERLEEQKQKKQMEYEEAHKLKNMIKGLDDDEVEFLDLVDQKKLEAEQLKNLQEQQELSDFRKKVQKLKENSIDDRITAEIRPAKVNNTNNSSGIKSQHKLFKGVLVKKKNSEEKNLSNSPNKSSNTISPNKTEEMSVDCCRKRKLADMEGENSPKVHVEGSGLTCVGILPGLGSYAESSDESDHSCSSASDNNGESTKFDLVGRRIVYKTKEKSS